MGGGVPSERDQFRFASRSVGMLHMLLYYVVVTAAIHTNKAQNEA